MLKRDYVRLMSCIEYQFWGTKKDTDLFLLCLWNKIKTIDYNSQVDIKLQKWKKKKYDEMLSLTSVA